MPKRNDGCFLPLPADKVALAASALRSGNPITVRLAPECYVYIVKSDKGATDVDFACAGYRPPTEAEKVRAQEWCAREIPAICKAMVAH